MNRRVHVSVARPFGTRAAAKLLATPPVSVVRITKNGGRADAASADSKIAAMYQRKTPVEHVLLRPGMYIGATDAQTSVAWVAAPGTMRLTRSEVSHSPGLLKLFDEILVNACDNKARNPEGMTRLEVTVDAGGAGRPAQLSIMNDGRGIPIVLHPSEGVYVPDLIFGTLLTGSNFGGGGTEAGAEESSTGGRHGYGAKLTNIFSKSFRVETADTGRGLAYSQAWTGNMTNRGEPTITQLPTAGEGGTLKRQKKDEEISLLRDAAGAPVDFTRVTFAPDLTRFCGGMRAALGDAPQLDAAFVALITRRVLDAAGVLSLCGGPPVMVTLNGKTVPVSSWPAYVSLYCPPPMSEKGNTMSPADEGAIQAAIMGLAVPDATRFLRSVHFLRTSPRLEVGASAGGWRISGEGDEGALEASNTPGCIASFVNGMATPRGGTHVALVTEVLARRLAEYAQKRLRKEKAAPAPAPTKAGAAAPAHVVVSPIKPDSITPAVVKAHLRLWINTRIPGPTFDSQSKEQLVTGPEAVAAALVGNGVAVPNVSAALGAVDALFSDKFIKAVAEEGGVYAAVVADAASRAQSDLARSLRKASRATSDSKVKAIPKLEDANWAGGRRAGECTLILTEGDSAKALAVAGLAVVGRDAYGVFPLRGKLLNVRDVSVATALDNTEVAALITILGLDLRSAYGGEDGSPRGLRYGRVMIMADQDVDGSHIKGLILNLFHVYWPSLLASCATPASTFVQAFVTPVMKARAGSTTREFYSVAQFEAWRAAGGEATARNWAVKYYKGLGTSTSEEGRAYFRALAKHVAPFVWRGAADGDALALAFAKDRVEDRKTWLAAAADAGVAPAGSSESLEQASGTSFSAFVHKELIAFSQADLARSIPSVLDGLKPSQRKVLFACFRRAGGMAGVGGGGTTLAAALRALRLSVNVPNADTQADEEDKATQVEPAVPSGALASAGLRLGGEVKVAQLAGYVAEHTAYHHGEASLTATIMGMAQDFVGSNNVPLLAPVGQFGTRLQGGKDAASARYIFTRLTPASRLLFPSIDDELLARREDDGSLVEPIAYLPVVPTLLLNGGAGIGTGWSTFVPPCHPLDVCDAVEAGLAKGWHVAEGQRGKGAVSSPFELSPWWRGFKGSAVPSAGGVGVAGWSEGFATWGMAEWVQPRTAMDGPRKARKAALPGTAPSALLDADFTSFGSLDGSGAAAAASYAAFASDLGGGGRGDYMDGLRPEDEEERLKAGPGGSVVVRVSELPIGRWTEEYKAFLQGLLGRGVVKELREYHSEATAEFVLTLTREGVAEVRALADAARAVTGLPSAAVSGDGKGIVVKVSAKAKGEARDAATWPGWGEAVAALPQDADALLTPALHAWLRLSSSISTRNMHAFDAAGRIARFGSPWDVVRAVLPIRGAGYVARAARLEAVLREAHTRALARARFLKDITTGSLVVAGKGKAELVRVLWERGFPVWDDVPGAPSLLVPGRHAAALAGLHPSLRSLLQLDPISSSGATSAGKGSPAPGSRAFDYLLALPLWQLTAESTARAEDAVVGLTQAVKAAAAATPESLWRSDLAALREHWQEDEALAATWRGAGVRTSAPAAPAKTAAAARAPRKTAAR